MPTLLRAVSAVLVAFALTAAPVRADGSRELTNSGGARPYLEALAGLDVTSGIPRDNRIYVWTQPGETLLVASSAVGVGAGGIELTRPDGTVVRVRDLPACWNDAANGTARAVRGRIVNVGQEVAGPSGSTNSQAGGYNACEVAVGAGQGGIWRVHYTAPQSTSRNPPPIAARASWSQPDNIHAISAWDVTVRNAAGANVLGRAWARYLPINTGNYTYTSGGNTVLAGISSTLYAITRDGYRWTVDHNGLVPFGAIIMATRRGFIDAATGDKGYTSVTLADLQGANGNPPAYTFKSPEQFDVDGAETTHKLFFAPLAADLPATDRVFFNGQTRTDWIFNRSPKQGGQVTSYRFVGADGVEGQVDPSKGGRFEFQTDGEGAYTIRIDRDRDPSTGPNGFEVNLLRGQAGEGANTVPWDGRDENGDAIAPGLYEFEVGFVPRRGEIHFPYFDAELNPDGIILTRTNGPLAPDRVVYWDDRRLGGTASLTGTDSQNGAHRWGDTNSNNLGNEFGNEVGIDTWAYVDYAEVFEETAVRSASVDLGVDVIRRTDPVGLGGPVTYDIVVTNNGPDAAPLARLTDAFPAELTGVTWSCAVTTDAPGPVANRCAPGSASAAGAGDIAQDIALNPGAALTFTVQATHDGSAGAVQNQATVAVRDAQDTVPANDTDADTFTPSTEADLRLAVSVDDAAPEIGDTVTFTVDVTNDGPSASTGFTASAALTGDLAYAGFQSADGTFDGATFTVASLAPGETATLQITATVSGPNPGTLASQILTASEPDSDSTPNNGVATEDDQDAATVTPARPDLELSVAVDEPAPALGTDVTFTITLDNASAEAGATGVDVDAFLPPGYTFVSASTATGGYNDVSETWSVGSVAAGGQAVLTITATANTTDAVTFGPEVSAQDQPDLDSTPGDATGDDADSVPLQAFAPDLALAVSVDDDQPGVGDVVTFTLDLTSENAADASGVGVSALLPAGLELVSATPSQGTYTNGTWSVGSVAGGGSVQLVIEATVRTLGTKTLSAEIDAQDQPDADSTPGNGSTAEDDDAAVSVTPQPIDLELALSVSDDAAPLGTDVTFTIDLDNVAAVDASGVAVLAPLPAGYTFVSADPALDYNATSGVWTVGDLAASGSARLDIVATVASAAPGDVTAQVSAADQPDRDSTPNNSVAGEDDQASAGVSPGLPDLEVSVQVSDPAPALGTDVTFVVTLDNIGPADATGVDLAALLPAGYTLVSSDPSQGGYSGGRWTVGSVGPNGQATLTLVATATTIDAGTFAPEVTAQDQPDADSTPNDGAGDDSASVGVQAFPPDLALAVSASTATPVLGETLTLTVDVTSENVADATGVDVDAAIPAGYEFVSSNPSQGSYNSATGTWAVGPVAGNGTAQLVLTVRPVAQGAAQFAAEVAAMDQPDGDSTPGNGSTTEDDDDAVALTAETIDLELAVSVSDDTPTLGDPVTFTVTLDNAGAADATGVSVAVPLPAGYTFVSVPAGTSYDPATGVWTVGPLASLGRATLEITATVDAPTPDPLVAQVRAADQPDADSAPANDDPNEDDQDSQSVAVGYADLALDVDADDASPAAGQQVTLTVDLTNEGTLDATGVVANAAIPAGYTLVSATPSQGTYDPGSGVWTVGTVATGGTPRLTLVATASAGEAVFQGEVTAQNEPDADSAPANSDDSEDDQDSVTLTGRPIDLSLTVAASDPAPDFGDAVTFSVTLTNDGPATATGAQVLAPLPAGYAFVLAGPESAGEYDPDTGIWTPGPLAAGESITIDVVATAQTLDPATFAAQVSAADQSDSDSTPGNSDAAEDDQAEVSVQAQPIDLSLAARVDDATPALGDDVTFTFTLTNAGPADATDVVVTAPLPAGYTFVSATPGVTYDPATGTWTIAGLAAGTTLDLTVTATATTTDPATISGEVTAAGQPDSDSTPGDGTGDDAASVSVQAQPTDLAVSISVDDAAPAVGDEVTFTIDLDNQSATGATGVDVTALLPDGLTFVSSDPSQGTYDPATGQWSVGAVGPNGAARLTVTATATTNAPLAVTAQVTAADQPDADSTPNNDDPDEDDQSTVTIAGQPTDLALAVSVDDAAPAFGEDVTFTLDLTNQSGTTATGVDVAGALPVGYTFVSATPSQGTYDPTSGTWAAGTVVGNASASLVLVATAQTADPATFTAQVSAASPADLDSTPGNGIEAEDDQQTITLQAVRTDLALTLAASDPAPGIGEETTLTLTVTNESAVDASGIAASLPIPDGYTLVSATPDQGAYAGGLWSLGDLAGNAQATLAVVLRADALAPVSVTAEITAQDQPDVDSAPGNGDPDEDDQQTITLSAQPIDLAITASIDDASPAPGQTVTYTVVLDNESAVGATGVRVDAAVPAGITVTGTSASAGTYDAASGTWTVGALGANGQATLTITGTVDDLTVGDLTAQVSAADQPDQDSTPGNGVEAEDDQQTVSAAVEAIDLELAVSVSDAAPAPGDDVTFTVTLDNVLGTTATGVTVSAPLPDGYTFVSSTAGASYDPATGLWTVGSLPTGTTSFDLVATVATGASVTFAAQVATADQTDVDSAPGNGAASEDDQASVAVTPQVIDLALAMSIDEPLPNAGDVVTFVVTVTNEGVIDATGVQVSDRLIDQPGVAEIVSVTPSAGTFDGAIWDVGALAVGESQTLTVEARLVADEVAFTNLAEVAAADQPDRDSVPYNGSTFEDDYAQATATTGGSSSGGEGGLESNGSLAEAIGSVLFARRAETGALADAGVELEPVTLDLTRTSGASIRRYVPASGPRGATAVEVSPTDLLPVTNAREIVAADYLRADGRRAGVVFASATAPGEIYEHTKPVCDRLRGARLDLVSLVDVAGHPFVMTRLVQHDGSIDYAVSFVAYGDAASRTVDSRFLLAEYDAPASGDDVLNLQVWSPSREHTASLVAEVLAKLAAEGDLDFRNTWETSNLVGSPVVSTAGGASAPVGEGTKAPVAGSTPALPTVFVRSAEYAQGRIQLDLYNAGGATSLRITGGTLARAEGGGRSAFDRTVEVEPGTPAEPIVPVTIDTGYLFDVAFFVETDLSPEPDRLYLADGTWGVAVDRSSETTRLENFAVRPQPEAARLSGQRLIERPVRATGTVSTWATVYRTLRAGALPLDLGGYRYVEFTAAGDGRVQVLLQKLSIASADQYGAMIMLTPEPKLHRIWFEDLHLADGSRGFTGDDAVAISITRRSDGTPQPLDVAVSGLRFGGAPGDENATPEEPSLWPAMPNPFLGATRLRYELPDAQHARVRVFDVLGREVARLADGEHEAGRHTLTFDGRGLSAGIYIVRMELADRAFTRQITLIR